MVWTSQEIGAGAGFAFGAFFSRPSEDFLGFAMQLRFRHSIFSLRIRQFNWSESQSPRPDQNRDLLPSQRPLGHVLAVAPRLTARHQMHGSRNRCLESRLLLEMGLGYRHENSSVVKILDNPFTHRSSQRKRFMTIHRVNLNFLNSDHSPAPS